MNLARLLMFELLRFSRAQTYGVRVNAGKKPMRIQRASRYLARVSGLQSLNALLCAGLVLSALNVGASSDELDPAPIIQGERASTLNESPASGELNPQRWPIAAPVEVQINVLTQRADQLTEAPDFEAAQDALINALYLIHREEGVTTPNQAPIIQRLRDLALAQFDYRRADQFEHLTHFLAKRQSIGDYDSDQALYDWYLNTGQYQRARSLLKDMADLVSQQDEARRQAQTLAEADLSRFMGRCCQSDELTGVLETLTAKQSVDLVGLTRKTLEATLLESGRLSESELNHLSQRLPDTEAYLIPGLRQVTFLEEESIRSRILEQQLRMRYGRAQSMFDDLEDDSQAPLFFIVPLPGTLSVMIEDRTGFSAGVEFANDLVGEPILFPKRKIKDHLPARYQRDANLAELSVTMTMTITPTGKVEDLAFESGTPGQIRRFFVDVMKRTRFTPAIQDGQRISSSISLTQTFKTANDQAELEEEATTESETNASNEPPPAGKDSMSEISPSAASNPP